MLPPFYTQVTPLRLDQHQTLFIEPLADYRFASSTNSVVIAASEFSSALVQYPIVFVTAGDSVIPAVITGLRDKQNLFVDQHGAWDEGYIPAYVRRYPFVVAQQNEQLTVCIDESYAGINRENQGEPLFDEGAHSAYLQRMIRFLEGFEQEFARTRLVCRKLVELDLLKQTHANIELKQTQREQFTLTGFQAVDREKLAALPADTLKQLQAEGVLELIYQHLASLERFNDLFKRLSGVAL